MTAGAHFLSAVSAGKRRRASRVVAADGRCVLVAMDHPAYMGTGVPTEAVEPIASAQPDAVLTTWHLARRHPEAFARSGLVLRVDGGIADMGEPATDDTSTLLYTAEQAMVLGADAIIVMAFSGAHDEHVSLSRLAHLSAECEKIGMVLIAESIPGGWAQEVPWTVENVAKGTRIATELGADMIKTMCPGPTDEFTEVVEACGVPVLALGGPRMDHEDDVIEMASGVVEAGAAGVAIGRNVWGSRDPKNMVTRLMQAVHGP